MGGLSGAPRGDEKGGEAWRREGLGCSAHSDPGELGLGGAAAWT